MDGARPQDNAHQEEQGNASDTTLSSSTFDGKHIIARLYPMDALGEIDPRYRFAVDYAIVATMMRSGKRLLHRPGVIAAFGEHPDSKHGHHSTTSR
jgi:hypothetical protein